jgi:hypothetical protein
VKDQETEGIFCLRVILLVSSYLKLRRTCMSNKGRITSDHTEELRLGIIMRNCNRYTAFNSLDRLLPARQRDKHHRPLLEVD